MTRGTNILEALFNPGGAIRKTYQGFRDDSRSKKEEAEREKQMEEERKAYEQALEEAQFHNNTVDRMDFMQQMMGQAPTYSAQMPFLNQYYDLYSQLNPTAQDRMGLLSQYGGGGMGMDFGGPESQMSSLMGFSPEQSFANQMYGSKFMDEFSQPVEDEQIESRNMDLLAQVMANPQLAQQYYGRQYNPNIIDQAAGRAESFLPWNWSKGYDEIMRERRLDEAGLRWR